MAKGSWPVFSRRDHRAITLSGYPRLGVTLKLGESRLDCLAMGLPHPLIRTDKSGQRDGFRSGKSCILPSPVLDRLCRRAVLVLHSWASRC